MGMAWAWDVVGSDDRLQSLHVVCSVDTPDEAADRAVEQVLHRYGPTTELRRWTFSVRPVASGPGAAIPVRFYVSSDGRAARLEL
jgi:hypothetical protein